MSIPDYKVGQYVRLKPFPTGSQDIRCVCDPDSTLTCKRPENSASELGACWHGAMTTVLRVFKDGGLLLENRHGFVRGAQPDEVWH
jgi:hypothetical protein